MENWKLASIAAIAIIALAGITFAAGGWRGGYMMGNNTNGTVAGNGFMRGYVAGYNAKYANATYNQTDATNFKSAVLSGDWATASQLHSEYGFGSPLFDRLNATTFAQVSQIANLQQQIAGIRKTLGQELDFNASAAPGMRAGGFGSMKGFGMSRGGMRNVAYHQTPTAVPDN